MLFHRNDLDGIVATLKDHFKWHLQENKPEEEVKNREIHEKNFREAKPFLDPVFGKLNEDDHWEDILLHPPRRIEVTLLPMSAEDHRRFPNASDKALTLFISLPKGCMKRGSRKIWGTYMPDRFHFDEDKTMNMDDFYVLIGTHFPSADM